MSTAALVPEAQLVGVGDRLPRPASLERVRGLVLVGPLCGMPALLGALEHLSKVGLDPTTWQRIQGASGGGLIAVGTAYGYSPRDLRRSLVEACGSWAGVPMNRAEPIRRWLEKLGRNWSPVGATFRGLEEATGVEVHIGATKLYRSGANRTEAAAALFGPSTSPDVFLAEAAAAGAAMPGLFHPAKIGEYRYMDGAVRSEAIALGKSLSTLDPEEVLILTTPIVRTPKAQRGVYDIDLSELLRAVSAIGTSTHMYFGEQYESRTIRIPLVDADLFDISQPAGRVEAMSELAAAGVDDWLRGQLP